MAPREAHRADEQLSLVLAADDAAQGLQVDREPGVLHHSAVPSFVVLDLRKEEVTG